MQSEYQRSNDNYLLNSINLASYYTGPMQRISYSTYSLIYFFRNKEADVTFPHINMAVPAAVFWPVLQEFIETKGKAITTLNCTKMNDMQIKQDLKTGPKFSENASVNSVPIQSLCPH